MTVTPLSRYDGGGAPAVRPLITVSAAEWEGRAIPERRWLVRDMVPEGVVTMLNGDGGVGKSLLGLQLAAAVAGDFDWIGTLPEHGPVLYMSAEDDIDENHRRVADILAAKSKAFRDLHGLHIASLAGEDAILAAPEGRMAALAATPLWRGLDERVAALRPRLVAIDNLADVFGGDEISRSHARQFIGMLRSLAIRYSTSVLLLAHPSLNGLNSGTGTSGSTGWNNSVRSRLYLDRPKGEDADPDLRVLRVMKANHAPTGSVTKLRWRAGVLHLEGPGSTGYNRAAAEAAAERMFLTLLARLTAQGRNVSHKPSKSYAPAVFAKQPENGGIQSRAFEAAMNALFHSGTIRVEPYGPPSKGHSRIAEA